MSYNHILISGLVLSRIASIAGSADHDTVGILIGKTYKNTSININDGENTISQTLIAAVNSYVILDGRPINAVESISTAISSCTKDIVGWFVCRKNTPSIMSIREKAMHGIIENLVATRKTSDSTAPLLFGMFNFTTEKGLVTHTFQYSFIAMQQSSTRSRVINIPVKISNMQNSSRQAYTRCKELNLLASSFGQECLKVGERDRNYKVQSEVTYSHVRKKIEELLALARTKERQIRAFKSHNA